MENPLATARPHTESVTFSRHPISASGTQRWEWLRWSSWQLALQVQSCETSSVHEVVAYMQDM